MLYFYLKDKLLLLSFPNWRLENEQEQFYYKNHERVLLAPFN